MCEYCGCQALASIDALTREHEQVLAAISDVRAARLAVLGGRHPLGRPRKALTAATPSTSTARTHGR